MSPEQAQGLEIDQRADIYSLGCVMYEMLTGAPPFLGRTAFETMLKHLHEQPECFDQASLGREVPASLESIVLRALAKEKENRYETMEQLKDDLEKGARQKKPHLLAQGRAAPNQAPDKARSHIA